MELGCTKPTPEERRLQLQGNLCQASPVTSGKGSPGPSQTLSHSLQHAQLISLDQTHVVPVFTDKF